MATWIFTKPSSVLGCCRTTRCSWWLVSTWRRRGVSWWSRWRCLRRCSCCRQRRCAWSRVPSAWATTHACAARAAAAPTTRPAASPKTTIRTTTRLPKISHLLLISIIDTDGHVMNYFYIPSNIPFFSVMGKTSIRYRTNWTQFWTCSMRERALETTHFLRLGTNPWLGPLTHSKITYLANRLEWVTETFTCITSYRCNNDYLARIF